MTALELRKTLRGLGSNPTAMAKSLEALGIKGCPGDAETCPLANYIKSKAGVKRAYVYAYAIGVYMDTAFLRIPTPKYVNRFTAAFDAEKFPALVEAEPVQVEG
jgi:hypothetical protein